MPPIRKILSVCCLFIVSGVAAYAQEISPAATLARAGIQGSVPRLVQFGAVLEDAAGRPVSGLASVTFSLYAEQSGGSALWTETQNVLADAHGHYTATLGVATNGGFPAELFGTGESRWLGVAIARQTEMPRILLANVPYALKAGDAQTLGGLPASDYVTAQQLAARSSATTIVSTGGAAPQSMPDVAPAAQAPYLASAVPQTTPSPITGGGTAQYLPLWTAASNLANSKIFQSVGGNLGINTITPSVLLDVNGDAIVRGSLALTPQATATASAGQPSHSVQWLGSVFNSSTNSAQTAGFAFRAVPDSTNGPSPTTKFDLFYGPGGGSLTDTGLSVDHAGNINFVASQTFPRATGVLSNTDFVLPAVFISNSNPVAYGMEVDTPGSQAFAARFGSGYVGIYATGATYAAILDGDVQVTGNLSKAGGSFKIDDPIDPAHKYLSHSFVESPDMMDVYNGNVTTDAKGIAVVTMQDWFEALNSDYRYQLTTMGQFAQAMVSKEIANGQFTIQTDKPNVKVSWQVTGIRHDAWANAHRIPVEEQKPANEQGKYLHPALFGAGPEKSITAAKAPPTSSSVATQTARSATTLNK
jgi:hypothetical protein